MGKNGNRARVRNTGQAGRSDKACPFKAALVDSIIESQATGKRREPLYPRVIRARKPRGKEKRNLQLITCGLDPHARLKRPDPKKPGKLMLYCPKCEALWQRLGTDEQKCMSCEEYFKVGCNLYRVCAQCNNDNIKYPGGRYQW